MVLSASQAVSTSAMHTPQLSVCDAACWHKQSYMLVLYDSYVIVKYTIVYHMLQ